MLQTILHITGLGQRLQAFKDRIEGEAQDLLHQGKAVAMQFGLVVTMGIGAAILTVMALVAGFAAIYLWLAPQVGSVGAMAIVAAGLFAFGAGLGTAAIMTSRKPSAIGRPAATVSVVGEQTKYMQTVTDREPLTEPQPTKAVAPAEIDSILALARQFAKLPRIGVEPIDSMIRALVPKAEDATKEVIATAANVIRFGDRKSMLAIFGTAMVLGWAITKANG